MTSYIIQNTETHRYIERRPYDGAWTWLAPFPQYATTFNKEAAEAMAATWMAKGESVRVVEDVYKREPQITRMEVAA